jgi:TctA family transporter
MIPLLMICGLWGNGTQPYIVVHEEKFPIVWWVFLAFFIMTMDIVFLMLLALAYWIRMRLRRR